MKYDKKSCDYQVNMEAFHEMDKCVPMTKPERDALRIWVKKGYDLDTNPWDYWKGPEHQTYWDDTLKYFIPKDDFC